MLNGTGVGHRMTMIAMVPSILASFEGLRSFVLGNLLIASSRDYDLLFCFYLAKIPSMHTMAILKARSG